MDETQALVKGFAGAGHREAEVMVKKCPPQRRITRYKNRGYSGLHGKCSLPVRLNNDRSCRD